MIFVKECYCYTDIPKTLLKRKFGSFLNYIQSEKGSVPDNMITTELFYYEKIIRGIYRENGDLEKYRKRIQAAERAVQIYMKCHIEKAGIKVIRVHNLRHSYVAYLINQGVEPLLIKERVGHKDIKITLNTYGHLYPNQQKAVAAMLDVTAGKAG